MSTSIKSIALWLLLIIGIVSAYFIGNSMGKTDVQKKFTDNIVMTKQITELAALQVNGIAKIKTTNADPETGVIPSISNFLMENTLYLEIPYTAKYGFDLQKNFKIENSDQEILLTLPPPELISFEMHLDKTDAINKKGLLIMRSDEAISSMMEELYKEQRAELEIHKDHLANTRAKAVQVFRLYFSPFGKVVNVHFDELINKTLPKN